MINDQWPMVNAAIVKLLMISLRDPQIADRLFTGMWVLHVPAFQIILYREPV